MKKVVIFLCVLGFTFLNDCDAAIPPSSGVGKARLCQVNSSNREESPPFMEEFFNAHETDKEYQFLGKHFIVSYADCNPEALRNVEGLMEAMREGVKKSGAQILNDASYVFPGNGLTMALLLSESHASIHTYPEHNACFVDLFTCGDHCHYGLFDEVLRKYLKPGKVNSKVLIRDEGIAEHLH